MARGPRKPEPDEPDALAQLHADHTESIGYISGLSVNGRDLFAARRKHMRELQSGRPDPIVLQPEKKEEPRKMPTGIYDRSHLNQRPINEVPITIPDVPHAERSTAPAPYPAFTTIAASTYEALAGGSYYADLDPAIEALSRGECLRFAVAADKSAPARQRLRKAAQARDIYLEIKSGPGFFAVRRTAKRVSPRTGAVPRAEATGS